MAGAATRWCDDRTLRRIGGSQGCRHAGAPVCLARCHALTGVAIAPCGALVEGSEDGIAGQDATAGLTGPAWAVTNSFGHRTN